MSKKIKLKNSTVFFIGFLIILIGITMGFYEYFVEKKNKAFLDMNILLYENEIPENVNSEENIDEEEPKDDEITNPTPSEPSEIKYEFVGTLEIPKINLKGGFLDLSSRYNNVNYNITVINGSTFPDQENNNLILAAHSGICSVCYFDNLYKLEIDDVAYISYNNIKYEYKIVKIYDVKKTGKVAIYRNNKKSTLTLITCTRNSDTKQTVYIFELVN